MRNQRLADLLRAVGVTSTSLAAVVGVTPKTVGRWLADDGCVPRADTRSAVAERLGCKASDLWLADVPAGASDELVTCYPARSAVPASAVGEMLRGATERLDVLAYAAGYLWETVDQVMELLVDRAAAGVKVRLLLADPDGEAVALRAAEEGCGELLRARVRMSWLALRDLNGVPGIELLMHDTTLYASIVHADAQLLVNTHVFGAPGSAAPVLALRGEPAGRIAATYLASLEKVANLSSHYRADSRRAASQPRALRPVGLSLA